MEAFLTGCLRIAAVAGAVAAGPWARAAEPPPPLTLAELQEKAVARNPTLAAASAAVRAAAGQRQQSGKWPNPVIGYEGSELTPQKDKWVRQTQHFFYLEQRILLGGKLKRGGAVFDETRLEAEARAEVQRQRVRNAVRLLYYDALVAARMVEARTELARIAREAVDVSGQLQNVGQADRPDVLEAEIEADRAAIALESAQHHRQGVWGVLAAMVGEPDMPLRPLDGNPEEGIPALDEPTLAAALIETSPEISAARAAARRGQAAIEWARSGRVGDLLLRAGPSYNYDTSHGLGGWAGGFEISFPLPLFNRAQGSVAAAQAEAEIAEAEVRRLELELRARLASEFAGYARARGLVDKYRSSVIPKAESAYQLYMARYREMTAAYPQVLIAQRTLAQVQAEYLDALDDVWRHAVLLQGSLLEGGLADPAMPGGHEAQRSLDDGGTGGTDGG